MCSLCGTLYSTRHWAETPGSGGAVDARRAWKDDRMRRIELLNRVLRPFALEVDDWIGTAYVLRAQTGETVPCTDLGTLFAEAGRMTGRQIDPLDGELLARWSAA